MTLSSTSCFAIRTTRGDSSGAVWKNDTSAKQSTTTAEKLLMRTSFCAKPVVSVGVSVIRLMT